MKAFIFIEDDILRITAGDFPGVPVINMMDVMVVPGGVMSRDTYHYSISSVNKFGESELSNVVKVVTPGNDMAVTLSWGRINNAEDYVVYRKAGNQKEWESIHLYGNKNFFVDSGNLAWTLKSPPVNFAKNFYVSLSIPKDMVDNISLNGFNKLSLCVYFDNTFITIDEVINSTPVKTFYKLEKWRYGKNKE